MTLEFIITAISSGTLIAVVGLAWKVGRWQERIEQKLEANDREHKAFETAIGRLERWR